MEASIPISEKERYRAAKRKDAHWYLLAALIVGVGLYLYPPFCIQSVIPLSLLSAWGIGIARRGKMFEELLIEAHPIIEQLKANGLTEHEAMLRCGLDRFYYSPIWAIR